MVSVYIRETSTQKIFFFFKNTHIMVRLTTYVSLSLSLHLDIFQNFFFFFNEQVVYAAAILSKSGKLLLSRQYADMQRIRVEGLLAAFPKLLADNSSKQHTFVETPQVRYLYHPLENMYVLLVTNKASNIMEDLDTLRMLSKVVPDCCPDLTEDEVEQAAFRLIFAFDEMITFGGYKVHITLNGIQGNLEMNSANENAFVESRMRQLEEAKRTARDNERRISEARRNHMMPTGFGGDGVSSSSFEPQQQQQFGSGFSGSGMGLSSNSSSSRSGVDRYGRVDPYAENGDSSQSYSKTPSRKGLKLGKKKKKNKFDKFARQMAKEVRVCVCVCVCVIQLTYQQTITFTTNHTGEYRVNTKNGTTKVNRTRSTGTS
jgi:hypothetical protein